MNTVGFIIPVVLFIFTHNIRAISEKYIEYNNQLNGPHFSYSKINSWSLFSVIMNEARVLNILIFDKHKNCCLLL